MSQFNVRCCGFVDVEVLAKAARKEHVVINDTPGSIWHGSFIGEKCCGCVCSTPNTKTVRFRGDYVLPELRLFGLYRELFKVRLSAAVDSGMSRATAYCTPDSIRTYLANGFIPIINKTIKHGKGKMEIVFVERMLP